MVKKSFVFAAIAILATVFLMSPSSDAGTITGKSVKIGSLVALTGPVAEWGKTQKIALDIVQEDINAAGGIGGVPLEIISYDTHSNPQESISMAKKLAVNDNVLMIVGPQSSSEVEVVYPVTNRMGIVCISPASSKPGLSAANRPWSFRNNLPIDKKEKFAISRWKKIYNVGNAVIIYDNADVLSKIEGSVFFPKWMKELDIKLLDSITFQTRDIDFSTQVTKTKQLDADGILVGALQGEAANLIREIKRQGLKAAIYSGAATATPDLIRIGGSAVEGVVIGNESWVDNPDKRVQDFVKKYITRAGGPVELKPNSAGFKAYDTVMITKMIMERDGATNKPEDLNKDRAIIRDGWAKLKNYDGIAGLTSIDKDGDGDSQPYALMVKDGKFIDVSKD